MRFSLPIISLFLVLLSGEALARPSIAARRNATLSAMIAKRQTNRNEIQLRAHVKDTVKRVHRQQFDDREEAVAESLGTTVTRADLPTRAYLAPRQAISENPVNPNPAGLGGDTAGERRALPAPARARARAAKAGVYRRQVTDPAEPSGPVVIPANANPDRRSRARKVVEFEESELEKRSSYPKCKKTTPRTGYAHYPGWKLIGDELSGAIPVRPEFACIQACNKYGGACSGVAFDKAGGKCYLKGTNTKTWVFADAPEADGVDLVGGCSLWSNIVPPEMDAVCCRD